MEAYIQVVLMFSSVVQLSSVCLLEFACARKGVVLSVRRVMMDHYSVVVEIEQKRVLFVHFISHIILMLNAEVK
jgi:hypothetical protein